MSELERQLLTEIRGLRREVKETRKIVGGVLYLLEGECPMRSTAIPNAAIADHFERGKKRGGAIRDVVGFGPAELLDNRLNIVAVRELRMVTREEVASVRGIGPATMEKLETAAAAGGLSFGEWVDTKAMR